MILVDSTVWIAYFKGADSTQTNYLNRALSVEVVLVGDIILAEVLQGFRSNREFEQAAATLGRFRQVRLINPALAVRSARNYRRLRESGFTIRKTIDCIIATYCIETGTPLLHADRDFDAFEKHLGLKTV